MSYQVRLEFLDGSFELVDNVTRRHISQGVLSLWRKDPYAYTFAADETHLGSYPLTALRKWVKVTP